MKTAIIYASKHGTTEMVARKIQKGLGDDQAQLFNLNRNKYFDLASFEQIIVGGSIHAGSIQKQVSKFLDHHRPELLERRLGLFLCCMHEQEAENEFKAAFPEVLRNHAISRKIVGGEFRFDKMNFIEKALVKKIAGVKETVSKIDDQKIRELVEELSNA